MISVRNFGSVSAGRAEGETVARYGSGAVLQNKTRSDGVDDLGPHGDAGVDLDTKVPGCSDWRHQGITPTVRHEQDQSGSGIDVVTMHTRGLRLGWI